MRAPRITSATLSLAAAAAAALTLAGCSFTNPQETTSITAAVPGVQGDVGPVRIEDLVVVSTGGGSGSLSPDAPGRLVGTLFNSSPSPASVTFSTQTSNTVRVTVPPKGELMLGTDKGTAPLQTAGGIPGGMATIRVSADGSSTDLNVPVVDGTLEQYRPFLPTPSSPASSPSPTLQAGNPSGTSTPSSTSTPSAASPSR